MKFQTILRHWGIPVVIIVIIAFTLVAWKGLPGDPQQLGGYGHDTIPKREKVTRQSGDKDLDYEMRKLDEAKIRLEEVKKIDWEKISTDVEEALKKIDFQKIGLEAEMAIKKIDLEKIQRDIDESLSKIDFQKIEKDLDKAMVEVNTKVDREKIREEIQKVQKEIKEKFNSEEFKKEMEEVGKIDMKEIQLELEKVKKEMGKVKIDLNKEKLDLTKTLADARVDIEKAKEELKGYQEMIYSMEKEGLLNTREDYKIEYRNGELLINGKKQPAEVTNKYKKYFKKDTITLSKKNGDFDIDNY